MTDTPLLGRRAVVTGGGRGLGRSIALALAGAGADVALGGRSREPLETVAAEIRAGGREAVVQPCDVTKVDQVEALMAAAAEGLGGLDILVNNSGVIASAPLNESTDAHWDRILETNLRGVFLATRAAGPRLVETGGKVINVASNWAFLGVPGFSAYCASKAAVVAFTRAMAVEWAPHGVQVNAIAPGYFETEMNADVRADARQLERIVRRIPAGRMGLPGEIGPLAVFLAGPASDFMTGETLVIDGGQVAR